MFSVNIKICNNTINSYVKNEEFALTANWLLAANRLQTGADMQGGLSLKHNEM